MPFSFIAKGLSEIEVTKGPSCKDIHKEIISNLFRSAIVLNESELKMLFYFFIVKLAPLYKGLETGIGKE